MTVKFKDLEIDEKFTFPSGSRYRNEANTLYAKKSRMRYTYDYMVNSPTLRGIKIDPDTEVVRYGSNYYTGSVKAVSCNYEIEVSGDVYLRWFCGSLTSRPAWHTNELLDEFRHGMWERGAESWLLSVNSPYLHLTCKDENLADILEFFNDTIAEWDRRRDKV